MPVDDKAHINPLGFREYDARWLYPKDINKEGIKNVGKGFGSQIISKTKKSPRVIVGHDYRSYSEEVKKQFIKGLMETGCNVEDIGLALSPTAYFAQLKLDTDAVAMITASHNENGWTGIKMGIEKGLTHSPDEMNELKKIVLEKKFTNGKGTYKEIKGFKEIYIKNLIGNKIKKKFKIVVACGNGTAGVFAPKVFMHDYTKGIMNMEDFGNLTFHKILLGKRNKLSVYKKLVDLLIKIQKIRPKFLIKNILGKHHVINKYSNKYLHKETDLFYDWYLPLFLKKKKILPIKKKIKKIISK